MAEDNSAEQSTQPRRSVAQTARQAGLFVLFGAMLMIPRIRRLRRRVWAWTFVRLGVAALATWLGWSYMHAGAGVPALVLSLLLFAFSLLVKARPAMKSADDLVREHDALVVLNGGAFKPSPDSIPVAPVEILVHPEHIIVIGPREHPLLRIPLLRVRKLEAHPAPDGGGEGGEAWDVEIQWEDGEPRMTLFCYDGAFAEHLARVTESTLRSQWIKELPVISS